MLTFKKSLVMISFLLLAACGGSGETKVTKIDGSSNEAADQSIRKMLYGMKDQESIQWEDDIRLIKKQYKNDYGQKLAGKRLEDLRPMIADSKTYWSQHTREILIADNQKEIDSLQAKLEQQKAVNVPATIISETESRIHNYQKIIGDLKALTDEQVFEMSGCSC
jgi:major membrane immunogen (membrane-anchored lipoprotein)